MTKKEFKKKCKKEGAKCTKLITTGFVVAVIAFLAIAINYLLSQNIVYDYVLQIAIYVIAIIIAIIGIILDMVGESMLKKAYQKEIKE